MPCGRGLNMQHIFMRTVLAALPFCVSVGCAHMADWSLNDAARAALQLEDAETSSPRVHDSGTALELDTGEHAQQRGRERLERG